MFYLQLRKFRAALLGNIPDSLQQYVKLLLNTEPTVRPDPGQLIKVSRLSLHIRFLTERCSKIFTSLSSLTKFWIYLSLHYIYYSMYFFFCSWTIFLKKCFRLISLMMLELWPCNLWTLYFNGIIFKSLNSSEGFPKSWKICQRYILRCWL